MMMVMMMIDDDDDDDATEALQPSQPCSRDSAQAEGCTDMAGMVLNS